MVARNGMLVGLFAFTAWGQTSAEVFYFTHLDTPQAMQEVSNAVRSIGDIRDVSLDTAKRSLTVNGTADQIAIAGWLTAELDKSGTAPGTRDFPLNDPATPLAQIIYLSHVDDPRELQEIVNSVRSVTDIQRCFPMNQQKAIVMRGSPAQVKAADWLLGELDQAAGPQTSGSPHEYRLLAADWVTRSGDLVLQVAALTNLRTMRVVKLNIGFTGVYNLVGLLLAALGFLPPALAAAAQSLPDLLILGNSSRLLRAERSPTRRTRRAQPNQSLG